jgi:hypothetical protein
VHLDDLLLRRTRIGFTNPGGGVALLPRIRPVLKRALGWDEERWRAEVERYRALWQRSMAPPELGGRPGRDPGARLCTAGSFGNGFRAMPEPDPSIFPWKVQE